MAKFDFDTLTLGEVAAIEDLSGVPIASYDGQTTPQGKFLAALLMVVKRRNGEPGFKFNDALATSLPAATAYLGFTTDDDEADAVEDADEGKGETSDESVTG